MAAKEELYFTNEHEWIRVNGDTALIGITDYAQESMGELVFVDLPEEGDDLEKGDAFGAVESVKAASDVYMPVGGQILKINEEVSDNPALVNEDAFDSWLIKINMTDVTELDDLMSAEEYEAFLSEEE